MRNFFFNVYYNICCENLPQVYKLTGKIRSRSVLRASRRFDLRQDYSRREVDSESRDRRIHAVVRGGGGGKEPRSRGRMTSRRHEISEGPRGKQNITTLKGKQNIPITSIVTFRYPRTFPRSFRLHFLHSDILKRRRHPVETISSTTARPIAKRLYSVKVLRADSRAGRRSFCRTYETFAIIDERSTPVVDSAKSFRTFGRTSGARSRESARVLERRRGVSSAIGGKRLRKVQTAERRCISTSRVDEIRADSERRGPSPPRGTRAPRDFEYSKR